jgi:1-phosphatidylinositol-4-phosphate 5-kinase
MSCFAKGCSSKFKKLPQMDGIQLATLCQLYRFSPQELLLYKKRFERMSLGNFVTLERFRENMGLLGLESTAVIADRIFALMDKTGRGSVIFEEYLDYMDILMHGTAEERAEQSFNLITKGEDVITIDSFSLWLLSVWKMYNVLTGSRISANEGSIRQHFDLLDRNKDGVVDLAEYQESMQTNSSLFEWFDFVNKGLTDNFSPAQFEDKDPKKSVLLAGLDKVEEGLRTCLRLIESPAEDRVFVTERMQTPEFAEVSPVELLRQMVAPQKNGPSFKFKPLQQLLGDLDISSRKSTSHFGETELDDINLQMLEEATEEKHSMSHPMLRKGASVLVRESFNTSTSEADLKLKQVCSYLEELLRDVVVLKSHTALDDSPTSPDAKDRMRRNVPKPLNDKALVSKKSMVHWGDENWNLVLNMMLGIQKAVKVAEANFDPLTELTDADFSDKCHHKLLAGQLRQQGSKVCKFRDYAPSVFERIRRLYGVSKDQYIKSLGVETLMRSLTIGEFSSLISLVSTGKSGSFFYYSDDGKYMLKTMTRSEYLFFSRNIKPYYEHLAVNPNTLIPRFFGFHKIMYKQGSSWKKIYFVVMKNVFSSKLEIHERYDLKGSTYGRMTEDKEDHTVARKDLNFINEQRTINIGEDSKQVLIQQLERDCQFFRQLNLIDYSLLLGVHYFKSDPGLDRPRKASLMTRFFEADDGGMVSTDGSCLYFMGVIDILTVYNTKKKFEHAWKASLYGTESVSCVPPRHYAERFLSFIETVIR